MCFQMWASSEGSSLRMPYTDKAQKQDKKAPVHSNNPQDAMESKLGFSYTSKKQLIVEGKLQNLNMYFIGFY